MPESKTMSLSEMLSWCGDASDRIKRTQDICLDNFDNPEVLDLLKRLSEAENELEDILKEIKEEFLC